MVIMENEVISLNTKTCCFSGHRELYPEKIPLLEKELNRIISDCLEKGYRRFLCGGAVGFDFLAAKTLLTYQNTCPEIQLELVFPYRYLPPMWKEIAAKANSLTYLSETYYPGCLYGQPKPWHHLLSGKRNRRHRLHCPLCQKQQLSAFPYHSFFRIRMVIWQPSSCSSSS